MSGLIRESIAMLAIIGVAFSLNIPEPSLLWKFFLDRSSLKDEIVAESFCGVISNNDTISCVQKDTIISDSPAIHEDCAKKLSPFSIDIHSLLEPLEFSKSLPESMSVNKTRTKIDETMCWKMKAVINGVINYIYFSADGFFKIVVIERKRSGGSKSDDVWEFREIRKGWDIPYKMTRSVSFEWGGVPMTIFSWRELFDIRPLNGEGKF